MTTDHEGNSCETTSTRSRHSHRTRS